MKKELDPIQKADIIRLQYDIIKHVEGVTHEMIDDCYQLLLNAEEEEVNYVANLDYILDQKARANGHLTDQDIEDMANHYEEGL
jgi:hypothetical protein